MAWTIVWTVADAHRGIVTLSNTPGRGGLATVFLPIELGTSRADPHPGRR